MKSLRLPFAALIVTTLLAACGGADSEDQEGARAEGEGEIGTTQHGAHTGCRQDVDCDDGLFCNGEERCLVVPIFINTTRGTCLDGTDPVCNDGRACTTDSCSNNLHACRFTPPDLDGDGHYAATCLDAQGDPMGDDCDDSSNRRFPGNLEVCNTIDEDCDSSTFGDTDADSDGYVASRCCNGSNCGDDCNDGRSDTHPVNVDPCDDRDNDCDGQVDENCQDVECAGEVGLYPDLDGDGFGAVGSSPVNACSGAVRLSPLANDCDDTNAAIKPGSSSCATGGVRTCGSDGQYRTATCPGILPRCLPQPNGTGICASL